MINSRTSKRSVPIDGLLCAVFLAFLWGALLLTLTLYLCLTLLKSLPMKTDKSKKVGGRRNAGPAATKSSVAKKPGGRSIRHTRGHKGYHGR